MARLKKFKFNSTDYLFPVEDVKVGTTSVVTDGVATIDLSGKADDNAVVKLTGNQTIAGTKTFSTSPVVPSKTAAATNTGTAIATEAQVYKKQDTLVSGTNIKTINSNSLLGSGDISLNDVKVASSAPASPTEGMVWYDTTNDKLKVYDGTNWNALGLGSGDVTGPSSSTDGDVALFDGTTGKAIKDSSINSANLVLTYGSQSISGSKIFVNEPVLPAKTTAATNTGTAPATEAQVYLKQDTLVSGTNIKTINSNSLVGSGDVSINAVPGTGTTGHVLTKTSNGYGWAAPAATGITNNTTGTTSTVTGIRAGTETEYTNLSTKSGTVLYFTF